MCLSCVHLPYHRFGNMWENMDKMGEKNYVNSKWVFDVSEYPGTSPYVLLQRTISCRWCRWCWSPEWGHGHRTPFSWAEWPECPTAGARHGPGGWSDRPRWLALGWCRPWTPPARYMCLPPGTGNQCFIRSQESQNAITKLYLGVLRRCTIHKHVMSGLKWPWLLGTRYYSSYQAVYGVQHSQLRPLQFEALWV